RLSDDAGNARRYRRALATGEGSSRTDHVYQFLNGRKFSRAWAAMAERNASRQHRPHYIKDCARSRFNNRYRSAATRHRGISSSNLRLFCSRKSEQTELNVAHFAIRNSDIRSRAREEFRCWQTSNYQDGL